MNNSLYTIKNINNHQFEINKSIFIGRSFKIHSKKEANSRIKEINEEYNDATHNCWAFIQGIKKRSEKYEDDGEPSGTAGKPILNVLKKNKLTNTLIVVTRYYGGIKLGGGGLIRAYSKSAQEVINKSEIKKIVKNSKYKIIVPYDAFDKLENYISNNNIYILKKEFEKDIYLTILIPEESTNEFLMYYKNLVRNKYQPKYIKSVYI
ncbi:MAG: YigZ family protein [Candidatus Mcinerneyibacterium aminivorans]|jgi:uncharacterized YigZ family protein|uniref:YigZ family protein n=1 Tax=Candidatus Mcinerneyibacterium aminivorans TaxID=2703815 RepID=A0A5D0MG41_9BACT|nr:MAG: YigZ family protein [Candidatus Mcinerneyibacterium aminivorans]